MIDVPVYSENGQKIGTEQIDEALLGGELNAQLLKQAVVMYSANQRQGTVAQKSRGEVEGSTKKLYRQKGTGRARAGNLRTPVRVGGGRAFPRKPRDYRLDMPRKMRRKARDQAILAKLQGNAALIVDGVTFDQPKTKRFATLLKAVSADKGCVFTTAALDVATYKSGRNIPRVAVRDVASLNAFDILQHRHLVFTREAFSALKAALAERGGK